MSSSPGNLIEGEKKKKKVTPPLHTPARRHRRPYPGAPGGHPPRYAGSCTPTQIHTQVYAQTGKQIHKREEGHRCVCVPSAKSKGQHNRYR